MFNNLEKRPAQKEAGPVARTNASAREASAPMPVRSFFSPAGFHGTPELPEANKTGIPAPMKSRFEAAAGLSLDDVRVHYNSEKPARLQALAYAQGNQIYMGPGQDRHLSHELGHVVQQKQGKVNVTGYLGDVPVNDSPDLERRADRLPSNSPAKEPPYMAAPVQRIQIIHMTKGMPLVNLPDTPQIQFGQNFSPQSFADADAQKLAKIFFELCVNSYWKDDELIAGVEVTSKTLTGTVQVPANELAALQTYLDGKQRRLTTGDYASGDMFAIMATLRKDGNLTLIVMLESLARFTPWQDMALESLPGSAPGTRPVVLPVPAGAAQGGGAAPSVPMPVITVGGSIRIVGVVASNNKDCKDIANQILGPAGNVEEVSVNYATVYVAKHWDGAFRTDMRNQWAKDDPVKDTALAGWLTGKGLPIGAYQGKKVLVIWCRFSGLVGEAHPEHDTSFQVVGELAALPESELVIYAGDKRMTKAGVLKALPAVAGKTCVDLTEFWKVTTGSPEEAALVSWGGNTRMGQTRLYDYLNKNSSLVHIGSRSGNLELMSMLGHKVLYMEEEHSQGGERMEAYQKSDEGKADIDKLNYRRIQLSRPQLTGGALIKAVVDRFERVYTSWHDLFQAANAPAKFLAAYDGIQENHFKYLFPFLRTMEKSALTQQLIADQKTEMLRLCGAGNASQQEITICTNFADGMLACVNGLYPIAGVAPPPNARQNKLKASQRQRICGRLLIRMMVRLKRPDLERNFARSLPAKGLTNAEGALISRELTAYYRPLVAVQAPAPGGGTP